MKTYTYFEVVTADSIHEKTVELDKAAQKVTVPNGPIRTFKVVTSDVTIEMRLCPSPTRPEQIAVIAMSPTNEKHSGNTRYEIFIKKLEHLINCEGIDAACGVPDFILAEHLGRELRSFQISHEANLKYHGIPSGSLASLDDKRP